MYKRKIIKHFAIAMLVSFMCSKLKISLSLFDYFIISALSSFIAENY